MVDNRSSGFFGIGGSFNFKSGDISGTAAKTSDDKMGQGGEYFQFRNDQEQDHPHSNSFFTDRSAQLRATLNSLAMMNVAGLLNALKQKNKKGNPLDAEPSSEEFEEVDEFDD